MSDLQSTGRRRPLAALPVLLALAGCGVVGGQDAPIQTGQIVGGATKPMTDVRPAAGFLPSPDLLAPGGDRRPALVYVAPDANLASYRNIMLDRVVIFASRDSQLNSVPRAQRTKLVDDFQAALYNALAARCHMVRSPGPNTMRLRFALTDAQATNGAVNTVASYTPYVSTAVTASSLLFNKGVGLFSGSASAEGYGTDAKTRKLVWQAVDRRGGTTAFVKDTLDNWLDVHNVMKDWAERVATRLQELGPCSS